MNLLHFLEKNEEARKIFGQQELKIIEKQLLGINLTQSEKNRLSRDIRKKFEFISKASRFEDDFKLKKGSEIKSIINDAIEVILESKWNNKIKKIILFGSSATKERIFRSDIDIAVLFKDINLREATKFRVHVSGRVNDKIDIQVYNILPDKIKKQINENGKVLWNR